MTRKRARKETNAGQEFEGQGRERGEHAAVVEEKGCD